jgi:hypothetical protein
VLVAADNDERALRTQRLGAIEATFDPLPITANVAREWGRLAAAVTNPGGQPRRRGIDLVIAATANVEGVPLLTYNPSEFEIIRDLTDARAPSPSVLFLLERDSRPRRSSARVRGSPTSPSTATDQRLQAPRHETHIPRRGQSFRG